VPLTIPNLDNRRYQDLVDEALARIPVYTPEWTNFNKSDPGVTLVEIFAFLTENLLYRSNQIPERNRKKFLKLLNVPLQPATAAQGLITINNEKNALATTTFSSGVEVRAGQTPFRTTRGLDVLPIETRFYYKRKVATVAPELLAYYQQLYASYRTTPAPLSPQLYQATPFPGRGGDPLDLASAIDGSLWLALLVRENDRPAPAFADAARAAIANKTLTLGVVPFLSEAARALPAGRAASAPSPVTLVVEIPSVPPEGGLLESDNRVPHYRALTTMATTDLFRSPGVIDVRLPSKSELYLWNNLDPLESGVNDLPPALDDTTVSDRIITWLRLSASAPTQAAFYWIGANTVPVTQRAHVTGELLPSGTGEPDQAAKVATSPILADSVRVFVTTADLITAEWMAIDDLSVAGPEVPVPDLRLPPGSLPDPAGPSKVFVVDAEAGLIRFGDGLHGARPPEGCAIRADYDYSSGAAGNVGPDAITTSPILPTGFTLTNPVATWGGVDAETAAEGEKQISRYLQHRDRLVTAADFETIALRTPGVDIGRVEVRPTYAPELGGNTPGDAAGAVTLMIIPSFDPKQPDAPEPSSEFLNAVCSYLDPRRLVTTEVFLCGPDYQGIWLSIAIDVTPGLNDGPVREAVKSAIQTFLAPLGPTPEQLSADPAVLFSTAQTAGGYKGWPLEKPVIALELAAVASRVAGVQLVRLPVLLARDDNPTPTPQIDISGLQLPRVLGISVVSGSDPVSIDSLRGKPSGAAPSGQQANVVQVPKIPEECR
jgi:hypothetical protein